MKLSLEKLDLIKLLLKQNKNLVERSVKLCVLLVNHAAEIGQIVDEVEQLADVVSDAGGRRVHPLQMLLVNLAYSCLNDICW